MSTHIEDPIEEPSSEQTRWQLDPAQSRVEFEAPTTGGFRGSGAGLRTSTDSSTSMRTRRLSS